MKHAYVARLLLLLTTMTLVTACSGSGPAMETNVWDQAFAQSMRQPKEAGGL